MPERTKSCEIARTELDAIPLLTLQGKLTLGEGSRELRLTIERIALAGARKVIVDLSGVVYVDSSGLGSLIAGYNALKSQGGSIALASVPKRVQDLLALSGLNAILSVFPTKEAAAQHFQSARR